MTATASPVPWWKHYGWQGLILPAVLVLLLGGYGISKLSTAGPDTTDMAIMSDEAAAKAARLVQVPTTEPAPPPTVAAYDYLECSSVQSGDPTPCVPVLVWPLTDGAKQMIGRQKGASYSLNTANTRIIYDQIRNKLVGVDACSMWLSIAYDEAANPLLTVWPSQAKAPQGAAKLVDCSPRAGATAGTIPTAGA